MTQEELKKLVEVLAKRLKMQEKEHACPICGAIRWVAAQDITQVSFQPQPGTTIVGGPSIPAIILVCGACGFLALHAALLLAQMAAKKE